MTDKPAYILWDHYKNKDRIFHQLQRLGQKLIIVYGKKTSKSGLANSINIFNRNNRLTIRINSTSAHVCEIELVALW
jgi:hypothetical protein